MEYYWDYYYWIIFIVIIGIKVEISKKVPFGKKSYFSREKGKRGRKGKRAKSQRTKVEGRRSLELGSCRINSGKGGLSSINGYYGIICDG